jgi:hypothetical protein
MIIMQFAFFMKEGRVKLMKVDLELPFDQQSIYEGTLKLSPAEVDVLDVISIEGVLEKLQNCSSWAGRTCG